MGVDRDASRLHGGGSEREDEPGAILITSNTVRKSIARVLTVINQKQRQNLREFYKKSKCEHVLLSPRIILLHRRLDDGSPHWTWNGEEWRRPTTAQTNTHP